MVAATSLIYCSSRVVNRECYLSELQANQRLAGSRVSERMVMFSRMMSTACRDFLRQSIFCVFLLSRGALLSRTVSFYSVTMAQPIFDFMEQILSIIFYYHPLYNPQSQTLKAVPQHQSTVVTHFADNRSPEIPYFHSFRTPQQPYNNILYQMKPNPSRKLFDLSEHQNFLLAERQLQIQQFQSMLVYKPIQTLTYEDGSVFKGELTREGERHGLGMLVGADGSVYMGRWANDAHHGEGVYLYPNGERYEGGIAEGMKVGNGRMYYLNGDVYEGEWEGDVQEGRGEMGYASGDKYVGEWRDGVPAGQGVYYSGLRAVASGQWVEGEFVRGRVYLGEYEGEWANGGPNGRGVYRFQNGVYEGQWRNGQKQGKGRYEFANGDFYEGEFRCGLKHGKGLYKYSTGDSYQGQFYNDYKHGYGVMKFVNNDQYEGQWAKDLFHGTGTYIFNGKQHINARFSYGIMQNQQKMAEVAVKKMNPHFAGSKLSGGSMSPIRVDKDYRIIQTQTKNKQKSNYRHLQSPLLLSYSKQKNYR